MFCITIDHMLIYRHFLSWLLLLPTSSSQGQTHSPSLTVSTITADHIIWITPDIDPTINIIKATIAIPPNLSIHLCVHHTTHSEVCSPPGTFHYPLSTLSNEGFGRFDVSVYVKDLHSNTVLVQVPFTIDVADARYTYPDARATYTGIELQYPKDNERSGNGILRIEPKITSSWPLHGSICIQLLKWQIGDPIVDQEYFDQQAQQICTPSSMRQFTTNALPPGHYNIQISVLTQDNQVLNQTNISNVVVLNATRVTEDYHLWYHANLGFPGSNHPTWMGVPVQKSLTDLWVYQEILHAYKPSLFIEFGTLNGGSALYMSHMLSLVHGGTGTDKHHVLTVDIDASNVHPNFYTYSKGLNVELFTSSSVSMETEDRIKHHIHRARGRNGCVLVSLDSKHDKAHVLKEMELVTKYLTKGDYLIVEDTQHNGHPIAFSDDNGDGTTDGPFEAVEEFFLRYPQEYAHDIAREIRFGFTWNPNGYLIKN